MGKALKRLALAAAVLLALACFVLSFRFHRSIRWRSERDSIQASAEAAERSGHPWAGVYLSTLRIDIGGALLVSPEGFYYGALYKGWGERLGHGLGRVSSEAGRLRLTPSGFDGADSSGRLAGAYRIVRWGDVRFLIRPDEAKRFVHCMARGDKCKDFQPFCTRGYVYGEPELPEELAVARREDPMFRPVTVLSVSGPAKRDWGWSWAVKLGAGSEQGLRENQRFYWDGSEAWIGIQAVRAGSAVGEIQQDEKEGPRMKLPLRAGMKVARWKPVIHGRPGFIYPMADIKR